MPNRPITATRKSKPRSSSIDAEGQAELAGHRIEADRRQREAQHHGAEDLGRRLLPMPMKLQKVRNWTAKNSAGPNCSAKLAR